MLAIRVRGGAPSSQKEPPTAPRGGCPRPRLHGYPASSTTAPPLVRKSFRESASAQKGAHGCEDSPWVSAQPASLLPSPSSADVLGSALALALPRGAGAALLTVNWVSSKLQTDMKTTNLEEMRIAMETYYEEVRALRGGEVSDLGGRRPRLAPCASVPSQLERESQQLRQKPGTRSQLFQSTFSFVLVLCRNVF